MTEQYTPVQILALPMEKNDAGAATIGEYFVALLRTLFIETEGFSGKRPFGNSGWDQDVDKALIRADAIRGSLDEYGYIEDYDSSAASAIVFDTLTFMSKADWSTLKVKTVPEDWHVLYMAVDAKGQPQIVDYFLSGMTGMDAKALAAKRNSTDFNKRWVAVHIPK